MFRRSLVLIAVVALAVAACNNSSPTTAPVTAAPTLAPALITPAPADTAATGAATQAAGTPAGVEVSISGLAFSPDSITVAVGGTVTWTNNDNVSHDVAAKDGSWASPILAQGQSWSHKFTAAGSVDYICTIHPAMKGTVVVTP